MYYSKPFYEEYREERFIGPLIPFVGGALVGGLISYGINSSKTPNYVPYAPSPYPYYNNYSMNYYQPYPYPYNNSNQTFESYNSNQNYYPN